MLSLLRQYFHTLKYLKWTQIKYRLIYSLWSGPPAIDSDAMFLPGQRDLTLLPSISASTSWLGTYWFKFLNIEHDFKNRIDWNYVAHGKLWTYNLTYFEFLQQPDLSEKDGRRLIHDFIDQQRKVKDGLEPFPISLRIISWVKFLIKYKIDDAKIDRSLYVQVEMLRQKPEYHLLGNHLLENGFALLVGGRYFADERVLKLAREILTEQLNEQILPDGAHFELSPMYHQIMLFRILDSINLIKNNPRDTEKKLLILLEKKAVLMLGWMEQMTFQNGDMAMVNDSTNGIAPGAKELKKYAGELGMVAKKVSLKSSGYRKIKTDNYELLVDVGNIGPDYIPGHAHSDTFNFILYYQNKPLLVDTGISTYEKNARRTEERSTGAHNTLMISGVEQSEVWGGFRVARRAKIIHLEESDGKITAVHGGYHRIGGEHRRSFEYHKKGIMIKDEITKNHTGTAFFHFHPAVQPHLEDQKITGKFGEIVFKNADKIQLVSYAMATGFNQTKEGIRAVVNFKSTLFTSIVLS